MPGPGRRRDGASIAADGADRPGGPRRRSPGTRAARDQGSDPAVLAAIAVGGILGSEARYALGLALPHAAGAFPVATAIINVSGSLALGALMVVLTELVTPHRLVRPLLGVGVLGGYTTFSTPMVDVQQLLRAGRPLLGRPGDRGGRGLSPAATAALGTGLCGALSTYSTFSYETLRLLENGMRVAAVGNVVVALAAGSGQRRSAGRRQRPCSDRPPGMPAPTRVDRLLAVWPMTAGQRCGRTAR